MEIETRLGKIQKVKFGIGGYQDAMIGMHFTLGGEGWGVTSDDAAWDANLIKCSKNAKWTEDDRSLDYSNIIRKLSDLLKDAKVTDVMSLVGKPIEVTFEDNSLKSWRILTEVI